MKKMLMFWLCGISLVISQRTSAQVWLDTIQPPAEFENVARVPLYSDSTVTVVVAWVKKGIDVHSHVSHTETVYILEGNGVMELNGEHFPVHPGMTVSVPPGHARRPGSAGPA